MAHLDPREDRGETMGWLDGRLVFRSRNLRGLITYARKHGITRAEIGGVPEGGGTYKVTFGNGATSRGDFASERVMLGFFLGRKSVAEIICCRITFNKGAWFGRINIPTMFPIGRDGTARFGQWTATAYRDEHGTALVRFNRS